MFVFGIDLPIPEMMVTAFALLVVAIVFIYLQVRNITRHIKILESTTNEIRKYEEEEQDDVRRLETDMSNLETDESEMFVTKIVPTVTRLENFVASELLKGKDPSDVKAAIVKKGINDELATKVVNSMTFYLDFFKKMPDKKVDSHFDAVASMKVTLPK